jgi:hypothetical protein
MFRPRARRFSLQAQLVKRLSWLPRWRLRFSGFLHAPFIRVLLEIPTGDIEICVSSDTLSVAPVKCFATTYVILNLYLFKIDIAVEYIYVGILKRE